MNMLDSKAYQNLYKTGKLLKGEQPTYSGWWHIFQELWEQADKQRKQRDAALIALGLTIRWHEYNWPSTDDCPICHGELPYHSGRCPADTIQAALALCEPAK